MEPKARQGVLLLQFCYHRVVLSLSAAPMRLLLNCLCRSRARSLDLVKKHVPEHLVSALAVCVLCPLWLLARYKPLCLLIMRYLQDTAKKTKWVVELLQGILADHDAAMESAQAVHVFEMVHRTVSWLLLL